MVNSRRLKKINEMLFREITFFVRTAIRNKHIVDRQFMMTRVDTTKDLTYAFIYIKPIKEKDSPELIKHLNHASSKIGFAVSGKFKMRRFPRLHFKIDESYGLYNAEGIIDTDTLI